MAHRAQRRVRLDANELSNRESLKHSEQSKQSHCLTNNYYQVLSDPVYLPLAVGVVLLERCLIPLVT